MTKRIFNAILLVALVVFAASMVLIIGVLYNHYTHAEMEQMRFQSELTAHALAAEGESFFQTVSLPEPYRLTWIDTDGSVLCDTQSEALDMENHLEREEIREAAADGYGESSRYSTTMTERYLYCARRLPDGTIVRLACEQLTLLSLFLSMLHPICLVIFTAIALSLLLAYRLSRYIVQPLNELNLKEPLSNTQYEELSPLLRRLDLQQQQLRLQQSELRRKQDEFDTATAPMNEGLILLGKKGSILTLNPSAARILHIQRRYIGYNLLDLCPLPELQTLLSTAKQGQHAECTLVLQERTYQLDASPVFSDSETVHPEQLSGIALLLFDITEKEQAEQLRREFTANVSHELKSPLHAISGYAELVQCGLARPEDIPSFAEKIRTESQRVLHLVEDILYLSHLDDGADDMQWTDVDLSAICTEVLRDCRSAADLHGITLHFHPTENPCILHGIQELVRAIVSNLCGNAIKYNRDGGDVFVSAETTANGVLLTVRDTGIGIPEQDQSRIFERFYRVDKSHSKEVGGTGLGLSIVKHAARIHHARIGVDSTLGTGTTVTVLFPLP